MADDEGNTRRRVGDTAFRARAAAGRGYVMESGGTTMTGRGKELLDKPEVRSAYLGI